VKLHTERECLVEALIIWMHFPSYTVQYIHQGDENTNEEILQYLNCKTKIYINNNTTLYVSII
jgi:hypothetical protein